MEPGYSSFFPVLISLQHNHAWWSYSREKCTKDGKFLRPLNLFILFFFSFFSTTMTETGTRVMRTDRLPKPTGLSSSFLSERVRLFFFLLFFPFLSSCLGLRSARKIDIVICNRQGTLVSFSFDRLSPFFSFSPVSFVSLFGCATLKPDESSKQRSVRARQRPPSSFCGSFFLFPLFLLPLSSLSQKRAQDGPGNAPVSESVYRPWTSSLPPICPLFFALFFSLFPLSPLLLTVRLAVCAAISHCGSMLTFKIVGSGALLLETTNELFLFPSFFFFLFRPRGLDRNTKQEKAGGRSAGTVIGHQWWWGYDLPPFGLSGERMISFLFSSFSPSFTHRVCGMRLFVLRQGPRVAIVNTTRSGSATNPSRLPSFLFFFPSLSFNVSRLATMRKIAAQTQALTFESLSTSPGCFFLFLFFPPYPQKSGQIERKEVMPIKRAPSGSCPGKSFLLLLFPLSWSGSAGSLLPITI